MLTHERGATRVPILAFLSTVVLFIAASFLAYLQWKEKSVAMQRRDQALTAQETSERDDEIVRHYVEDLAGVVGETGTYKGREGWTYFTLGTPPNEENVTPAHPEIAQIQLEGAPLPTNLDEAMNDFANKIAVPPRTDLAGLFGAAVQKLEQVQGERAAFERNEAALKTEIRELQDTVDTLTREASSTQQDLNSQLRQKDEDFATMRGDMQQTVAAANDELTRISELQADQAAEHARVVADLRRQLETLQARIEVAANKTRLINPAQAPDGMVIEASQAAGMAWVNLGRRDMLPLGTAFEIIKPDSGEVKASGVVTRLEQTRALLRITSLNDRFNPVVPGDQVRNDLFSPEMVHNIYLLGSFREPYHKPLLTTLLENLGNNVVDELTPAVDLVLVGNDPINADGSGFAPIEETEEYQKAMFLRLEMAPLSRMRQFLRLGENDSLSRSR